MNSFPCKHTYLKSKQILFSCKKKNLLCIAILFLIFNFAQIHNLYHPDLVINTEWSPSLFIYSQSFLSSPLLQSNRALSPLRPPPLPRCWPQPVQPGVALPVYRRGSGYSYGLTETHSKPCIWNLFLCSDTLHFICIFTYSEPGVHFLEGKTGHRQSWCVFISFQRVFCQWMLESDEAGSRTSRAELLSLGGNK